MTSLKIEITSPSSLSCKNEQNERAKLKSQQSHLNYSEEFPFVARADIKIIQYPLNTLFMTKISLTML